MVMTTIGGATAAALAGVRYFERSLATAAHAIANVNTPKRKEAPEPELAPVEGVAGADGEANLPPFDLAEQFPRMLLAGRGVEANVSVLRRVHDAYRSILEM